MSTPPDPGRTTAGGAHPGRGADIDAHGSTTDRPAGDRTAGDRTAAPDRTTAPDRTLTDRPTTGTGSAGSSAAGADRPATDPPGPDRATEHLPRSTAEDGRSGPHAEGATIAPDRSAVVAAQKERFGGVKWGSAFFGWLTATGTAVLLTGLVAAAGAAVGQSGTAGGAGGAVDQATRAAQDPSTAQTVGIVGSIALLVILFVAYYCGGYVAGRMARFNGMQQGVAVWVWGTVAAIVVAVLGAVAGSRFDVLANMNGLPRLPISSTDLTAAAIVAALLALAAALVGAVLGGLAGMRFHRRVDRAGFER